MSTNTKLGERIYGEAQRDAIHIAVAPVIAGEDLQPGEHVVISEEDGKAYKAPDTYGAKSDGVADPFLRRELQEGDQFWLMLHPGSITGLRHAWTHPAFVKQDAERAAIGMPSTAEIWLRAYAMKLKSYDTPEVAFRNMIEELKRKEIFARGTDLHGLYELEDAEELRKYASEYLGIPINWSDDWSFSCSC